MKLGEELKIYFDIELLFVWAVRIIYILRFQHFGLPSQLQISYFSLCIQPYIFWGRKSSHKNAFINRHSLDHFIFCQQTAFWVWKAYPRNINVENFYWVDLKQRTWNGSKNQVNGIHLVKGETKNKKSKGFFYKTKRVKLSQGTTIKIEASTPQCSKSDPVDDRIAVN